MASLKNGFSSKSNKPNRINKTGTVTRSVTLSQNSSPQVLSPPFYTSTQKSPLRTHINIEELKRELFDTVFDSLQNRIEDIINNAITDQKSKLLCLNEEIVRSDRALNDLKTDLNSVKEAQIKEINNHEKLIKENERLKTLIKQQDEVIQRNKERLDQECCNHKQQTDELTSLKQSIGHMKSLTLKQECQIEDFVQEKLSNICILSGQNLPPVKVNEKTDIILANLIKNKLNITPQKGSILEATRIGKAPVNNTPDVRPIKFKLKDSKLKQDIIKACITTKQGLFANEFLSIYRRKILKEALSLKKQQLISNCFSKNGVTYIRKSLEHDFTQIRRFEDLTTFKSLIIPPDDTFISTQMSFAN